VTRIVSFGKANKYGARRTWSDLCQRWFDSQAEARRGEQLQLMERAGVIRSLVFQPRFDLIVERINVPDELVTPARSVGRYVADAEYIEVSSGRYVVEDVKGTRTPVYRLKKKLVEAIYGIEVLEIEA
jgi:hypothetical protein